MYPSEIELVAGANNDRLFYTIERFSNVTTLYRMCDAQPVRLIMTTPATPMKEYIVNRYQPSVSADGKTLTVATHIYICDRYTCMLIRAWNTVDVDTL